MTDFVLFTTTTSSAAEAETIAAALVENRLAACVQIISQVQSVYRWQGKIEKGEEWLCQAKTRQNLLTQVEALVRQQHSYACPEMIGTPIEAISADYASWLNEQLRDGDA